jgi:2-iminobutanoate/2-iminopropanoate deaminase
MGEIEMDKKVISTTKAPAAIGPYSQAIEVNGMIFTSGMIPINPETGEIVEGLQEQAKQALTNVKSLLESQGSEMGKIIKTTVFIKDMNDFAKINEVYATFFDGDYPARSCVEVARLPKDVLIEIEAIALK